MSTELQKVNSGEYYTAYTRIPYALINQELTGASRDTLMEMTEICRFYSVYYKGADFTVEGSHGDYIPASLNYKLAASLVNKEARFLFAESPTFSVTSMGVNNTKYVKGAISTLNELVTNVLRKNNFSGLLLKAARDCFIGKRVAGIVNFNKEQGVTITFVPATQFLYETEVGSSKLIKFVCFIIIRDSMTLADKIILKKKYVVEGDCVYLTEGVYDGAGKLITSLSDHVKTLLKRIPVSIFINDGLLADSKGESDIGLLCDDEMWYSKLSNADIDAQRKSMNPTKYTIDMDSRSTENLSTAAGAFWDLGTDQNLDSPHPAVGLLEPSMNYSSTLDVTLRRMKKNAYEQIDMPDIEELQSTITSGKALKAIYWPLIVRCKEKMAMWSPKLAELVSIIIDGAYAYPDCVHAYVSDILSPVSYEVIVEQNMPLPEDEVEEKNMDLSEVQSNVMSRKAYMKKWRGLTDEEIEAELIQMAKEREILEDSAMPIAEELPYSET